jgi:hypothetical protein
MAAYWFACQTAAKPLVVLDTSRQVLSRRLNLPSRTGNADEGLFGAEGKIEAPTPVARNHLPLHIVSGAWDGTPAAQSGTVPVPPCGSYR